MAKYSYEFKKKVVQDYQDGKHAFLHAGFHAQYSWVLSGLVYIENCKTRNKTVAKHATKPLQNTQQNRCKTRNKTVAKHAMV